MSSSSTQDNSALQQKITALEAKIEGYESEYENIKTKSEKSEYRKLITASRTVLHDLLAQQQDGKGIVVKSKTISVVHPAVEKDGVPKTVQMEFNCTEDLKDYMRLHRGSLIRNGKEVANFSQLEDMATYEWSGLFYEANRYKLRREQVDAIVLGQDAAMAVQRVVGSDAHIHNNVKFQNDSGKDVVEIDAVVVHQGGENVPNSTAYIVECSYAPQIGEVDKLHKKAELFKELSKRHEHFRSVSSVVAVLGGRLWSPKTLSESKMMGQWQVMPSGGGYMVVRGLFTFARKLFR